MASMMQGLWSKLRTQTYLGAKLGLVGITYASRVSTRDTELRLSMLESRTQGAYSTTSLPMLSNHLHLKQKNLNQNSLPGTEPERLSPPN